MKALVPPHPHLQWYQMIWSVCENFSSRFALSLLSQSVQEIMSFPYDYSRHVSRGMRQEYEFEGICDKQ